MLGGAVGVNEAGIRWKVNTLIRGGFTDDGKMRLLGIPTVVDRLVQRAINQVLTQIYESQFNPNSYGFRPRRGCLDALRRTQKIVNEGYKYVVDLERFFDTVNHSRLMEILSRTIKDGRVVSLIHKYLRSGIMNHGMFEMSEEETTNGRLRRAGYPTLWDEYLGWRS